MPQILVRVPVTRSISATALFSCRVTQAVLPRIAIDSGSKSWATVAPWLPPLMRMPCRLRRAAWLLKASKVTVLTVKPVLVVVVGPKELVSITEIVPGASLVVASITSPSFATTSFLPSLLKLTESGRAPTVTLPRSVKVALEPEPLRR